MSFSMDIVLNKEVPVIMLGKDWLKYIHARYIPKLNSLEIRHKSKKVWTHIVELFQDWKEEEEVYFSKPMYNEFFGNSTVNAKLLINLNEEVAATTPTQSLVSKDIFLIDIENFQQEFNQSQLNSYTSNEIEKITRDDEIFDEIIQLYQEIMEDPEKEDSEILEETESEITENITSENSTILITLEAPISAKINTMENEQNEFVLSLENVNQKNFLYKSKEKVLELILQQQQLQQKTKMKMEKYVNYTSSSMLNIDDSNSLGYLNKVYQWKRRKKSRYKKIVNMEFTVPQILNC